MRLGVLDIGSNTVHLLVVDAYYGAAPVPAHSNKIELRLAEHIDADGNVDEVAERTLAEFLIDSRQVAEDLGVTEVLAFATSAIRESGNGDEVLRRVQEQTDIDIAVLSGPDEARLTFLAVRRWFGWSSGRLLVLDIGGGSLEIAVGADEEPDQAVSVPLGAGRLTRKWLTHDPPKSKELRELRKYIRIEIAEQLALVQRSGSPERTVATSKTFRQLARIAGAPPSGEGPLIPRSLRLADLSKWLPQLAEMSAAERSELPGVSAGRAGQLVAGALVAEAAMELLGVEQVEICPWALREGVILRRLDGISQ
ncbi:MAG: Ppx/GppA family phosphatase [Actinomycetia bacterium]|nr:Ppx/GppA family phosphatase [Actinomycetes bacterium]MCH9800883.1 Ppx/GppA family phosphatase [Actinomycetes bacterium]